VVAEYTLSESLPTPLSLSSPLISPNTFSILSISLSLTHRCTHTLLFSLFLPLYLFLFLSLPTLTIFYIEKKIAPQIGEQMKDITFDHADDELRVLTHSSIDLNS
jgi:hypothetical protein